MKKTITVIMTALFAVLSVACGKNSGSGASFSITSSNGKFTSSENVYTITSAGVYSLKGSLNGQIVVEAGDKADVYLELNGADITYSEDSPIKIISADSVEITAKNGSVNHINDTRAAKTAEDKSQGEGAIYAKSDVVLKGSGSLIVNSTYNNGIHTTKDLKIQKMTLEVTARGNAIKGNDSISITSGTVTAISTHGDGLKTKNTDVSKKGVIRGDISISGGTVTVYAAGDGFQAAHNFEMVSGSGTGGATVAVYTGSYSEYTASDARTSSYKGVKSENELNIRSGILTIHSYDDGLNSNAANQAISISGGTLTIGVNSPGNKTTGGLQSWAGQRSVVGADGIHADGILNISGGTIIIDSAYEGLEANVINFLGGKTYVSANDDGVNACKGSSTPQINVTGGYLDVTVSPNGDTDGIDSNGSYSQTGGIVITRGPNSQMAAAIDASTRIHIDGGTLIILGYGSASTGDDIRTYSLALHEAGDHAVMIGEKTYSFTNSNTYARTKCYSDVDVSI